VFVIGKKEKKVYIDENGNAAEKKVIGMYLVLDELPISTSQYYHTLH